MPGPKIPGALGIMLKQFGIDPQEVMRNVETLGEAVNQISASLKRIEEQGKVQIKLSLSIEAKLDRLLTEGANGKRESGISADARTN